MTILLWLAVGLLAVWPLLNVASKMSLRGSQRLLGRALVVAALVYVLFAAVWGNAYWVAVEAFGVVAYSAFYWLSARHSPLWLAFGWLVHPVWDVFLHLAGPGAHVAPGWYAVACMSFDVTVAVYIFVRVNRSESVAT
ncbi:MAG: DUF6010 family protein [Pseudomonadota bacterium]